MIENNIPELNFIEIGQRIKKLRDKMKQEEFADIFGIKQQDVSKIENAVIKPSHDLLLKLSLHYKKTIEWILTEKNEPLSVIKEPSPGYSWEMKAIIDSMRDMIKAQQDRIEAQRDALQGLQNMINEKQNKMDESLEKINGRVTDHIQKTGEEFSEIKFRMDDAARHDDVKLLGLAGGKGK